MAASSANTTETVAVENFSFQEFLQTCLSKWKWFLLSLIVFVGLAWLYVATREPVYERSEQILIKNRESGGGIGDMTSAFSSLGLFSSNSSVNNELISITSPAITYEVVRLLNLDMNYEKEGGMHLVTLYGKTLPMNIRMVDVGIQQGASFKCRLTPEGSLTFHDFVLLTADGKEKFKEEVKVEKIGDVVSTPLGKVQVAVNPKYDNSPRKEEWEVAISKMPMQVAVEAYSKKVSGDLVDEYADVIELVIRDVNVERAVDVLNEIVKVYNNNYIEDKNKIAKATSAFIDERLSVIQKELGEVDHSIADYTSSLGTLDLAAQGLADMEKKENYTEKAVALTNSLQMSKYLQEFMASPENNFKILPMNTGVESPELETQIGIYNELLINRNNLVEQSSVKNPLVQEYDAQLKDMRSALMTGVTNQIQRTTTALNSVKSQQAEVRGSLKSSPGKALPLISETRQQKVKENLYLYLLEKREENELTQKFTADNTRIITPPMGSLKPVSPKKMIILILGLMLGVGVPLVWIYLKLSNDTKVRSKKDLERVKMPFAGEIPQVGKQKLPAANAPRFGKKKKETAPMAVVEEGKRDVVNEAFRVIRSNIEFMSGKNEKGEVILLTSFNPGSGKSFISYNLGLSFAIKRKKVLLIDCDLRHGSSSMYVNMPGKGITNYLNDSEDSWKNLVLPSPANPNLMILPVGKMPPNPAELLENDRFKKLIEEARKDFDYILLDCPPVNIVVDAQIVGKHADRTLFVVRAGLLDRSALTELNEFQDEHKFNKMSIILNGTEATRSRYYTYGTYQSYND